MTFVKNSLTISTMSDVIGYIRVILPRYAKKGQADAMELHNVETVITEGKKGNGTRDDLLRMVRRGTTVAVQHLFLLADPKAGRKPHGLRGDLWVALDAVEQRGGALWELYSGLRSDTKQGRDEMMRAAVEALARGRHKRSAADKRGRPAQEFTDRETNMAKAAWHNRKLKTWADVRAGLPTGFTINRAYRMWGARNSD